MSTHVAEVLSIFFGRVQESELCGHIPLHPHLVFKETEPGQVILKPQPSQPCV